MKLKVLTWTPSRFAKWKECPAKVKYEDLLKMCPVCFKGRVSGGFNGQPVVCDTCDGAQPERPALDRGNQLDAALTDHLAGANPDDVGAQRAPGADAHTQGSIAGQYAEDLTTATRHPKIDALVKKLRKTKNVFTQLKIVLDKGWTAAKKGVYTKDAWARLTLDVLVLKNKTAEIIDWKSGNIDKQTNTIREKAEYHDSMHAYQMAVLSVYPQAEASVTMAFLDAPPKIEPFKSLPVLKRKDLAKAQKDWEKLIEPMMSDDTFSPKPGFYCRWCSFSKDKGGPCPY